MSDGMDLEKVLSDLANAEAVKQLDGKVFEFEQDKFRGQVRAIAPRKNLHVEITEFVLGGDVLTVKVKTSGLIEIAGALKQSSGEVGVNALSETQINVAGRMILTTEGDEFFLDPTIDDLDVALNITQLTPPNLSGGKALITTLVKLALITQKKAILTRLNERLGKFELDI